MTLLQLIVLALVQGITEFLPISSSGHLALIAPLTGWADQGLALDVAVHAGTLMAVMLYFWRDMRGLALAGLAATGVSTAQRAVHGSPYRKLFWAVVIATIPGIAAGLLVKATGLDNLWRNPMSIACATLGFGILLWVADAVGTRFKTMDDMKIKPALLIGTAQILALIPGTSRSGITMTAGRLLGFDRQTAARFSMLLSVPIILGAAALVTLELIQTGEPVMWRDMVIGAGLSALAALLAIHWLLKWLEQASMAVFGVYRILLGSGLLVLIYMGVI